IQYRRIAHHRRQPSGRSAGSDPALAGPAPPFQEGAASATRPQPLRTPQRNLQSSIESGLAGLLCDLDGVLRLWPASHHDPVEDLVGLPPGSIRTVAFDPDLAALAITGRISDEAWRLAMTDRLQATYPGVDVARAVAAWSAPIGSVNISVRVCPATAT